MDHRNRAALAILSMCAEGQEQGDMGDNVKHVLLFASDARAAVARMADVCFTESRAAWAAWGTGETYKSARASVTDPDSTARAVAQAVMAGGEPDWDAVGGLLWAFYPTGAIETELANYRRYELTS